MPRSISDPAEAHPAFAAAFNAGDADGLLALYESGAVLGSDSDQVTTGTAAIRAALAGYLSFKGKMTIETKRIFATDDGVALLHGKWVIRGAGPGGSPIEMSGVNTEVLRRQPDGAWLFLIDNPFTPGP